MREERRRCAASSRSSHAAPTRSPDGTHGALDCRPIGLSSALGDGAYCGVRSIGVAFLVLSVAAMAQQPRPGTGWPQEAMTADEERDARSFADDFTARLKETRDVEALMTDVFIADFPRFYARLLDNRERSGMVVNLRAFHLFNLTADVQKRLGEKSLATMYARTATFWYLSLLRRFSELPLGQGPGPMPMTTFLPLDAGMVLRKDRALARVLDAPLTLMMSDSAAGRLRKLDIDDAGQARRTIDALDRFADLMRRSIAKAEESPHYAEFRTMIAEQIEQARGRVSLASRATICPANCLGFPDGTRFFEVLALPFWHLHLVRTPSGLKLVIADLPMD